RAGVAGDVCAVAECDREAVALAEAGRLEVAPAGRGLAGGARPGAAVPGPVRARLAAAAGVRGLARQRSVGADDSWPMITDLGRQNSLGPWVAILRGGARPHAARAAPAPPPPGHLGRQLPQPHRRADRPALVALYQRIKNGPDGQPANDQSCSLMQLFDALVQYRNGVFGHGGP